MSLGKSTSAVEATESQERVMTVSRCEVYVGSAWSHTWDKLIEIGVLRVVAVSGASSCWEMSATKPFTSCVVAIRRVIKNTILGSHSFDLLPTPYDNKNRGRRRHPCFFLFLILNIIRLHKKPPPFPVLFPNAEETCAGKKKHTKKESKNNYRQWQLL